MARLSRAAFRLLALVPLLTSVCGAPTPVDAATADLVAHAEHLSLLGKRTLNPGPIWGANGVPDIFDVHQTHIPNCGITSVLQALVHHDKKWITNLVQFDGTPESATVARVNLYTADTLKLQTKVIPKASLSNDRGDDKESWWVGAVEDAIRNAGEFISMDPARALNMLTGRRAGSAVTQGVFPDDKNALTKDQAWALIKDWSGRTPLIFQSLPQGTKNLYAGHAWFIEGGHTDGARWVTMYNPWGWRETWDLDGIWEDCYLTHGFIDFTQQPDSPRKAERGELAFPFEHLFTARSPPPPPLSRRDTSAVGINERAQRQPDQRIEQDGQVILFYSGTERPPAPTDAAPGTVNMSFRARAPNDAARMEKRQRQPSKVLYQDGRIIQFWNGEARPPTPADADPATLSMTYKSIPYPGMWVVSYKPKAAAPTTTAKPATTTTATKPKSSTTAKST